MKEHDFELNTLMGGWYISEKICDNLVLYFNENKNEHFPGMSGNKVNKDIKDSVDIQIKKNHKNSILSESSNATNRSKSSSNISNSFIFIILIISFYFR